MGAFVSQSVPCAKGAVCYALDKFSTGRNARARIQKLSTAIRKLAPSYVGLAETFDRHLLSHVFKGADARARIVDHLKACWFDPASRGAYFPGVPVARIYAEGVLKALELSLKGKGTITLTCGQSKVIVKSDGILVEGAAEVTIEGKKIALDENALGT